jgi:hypothetical protein
MNTPINTMQRINQLSAERAALYRQASNGHKRDRAVHERIKAIAAEIEGLWEQRRVDRIGKREGIDLVIDRVYEHTYGKDFEDTVSPPGVSEDDQSPKRKDLVRAA